MIATIAAIVGLDLPKHMPHNPVKMVNAITQIISPSNVSPNMEKLNSSTNVV